MCVMASGGASPLNVIKAIEKYVRREITMGLTSEDVACAQQMPNIVTRIKTMTIDHDEACVAYEQLGSNGSIFSEEQCKEIAAAIKASMASPS